MAKDKISPGMHQYLDVKKDYPEAFLLFRMGDFYELFYADAEKATRRPAGIVISAPVLGLRPFRSA